MEASSRRSFLKTIGAGAAAAGFPAIWRGGGQRRPNILLAISDDQSWQHAGPYGTAAVDTPAFDRIAEEGVLFNHAYCAAPSCTPSRSAVTTGQEIWRLEEGGLLFGTLPQKFPVYTDLLEDAGYHVGYTGPGWKPGSVRAGGRTRNPCGRAYSQKRLGQTSKGISKLDYAANFKDFLQEGKKDQPFAFWFGASEAHRPYQRGIGRQSGKSLQEAEVPSFLPDLPAVRNDMLDYYAEIEWFDQALGQMLAVLEADGALENTIVVVTSDNGMPFPRAKANLYDFGTRVPLAIRWGAQVPGGRVVEDFVSLTDLAPTFLEAAGLTPPGQMTGRSLVNLLTSCRSSRVEDDRNQVVTAFERHTWCRKNGAPYPMRAIRTHDYLYIQNYRPDRWPAGAPDFRSPHQGIYGDVDRSPTRRYMIENAEDPYIEPFFRLGFGKRPAEELYVVDQDPGQINNVAAAPSYERAKRKLQGRLETYLKKTHDPRMAGEAPWADYPYYWGDLAPDAGL